MLEQECKDSEGVGMQRQVPHFFQVKDIGSHPISYTFCLELFTELVASKQKKKRNGNNSFVNTASPPSWCSPVFWQVVCVAVCKLICIIVGGDF